MKKIAFFVQHMLCGGVENALISLSKMLVEQGNEVTVFVIRDYGEFTKRIPNDIKYKLIPMAEKTRKSIAVGGIKISVKESIQNKKYTRAIKFIAKHYMSTSDFAELNVNFDKIPKLSEEYDVAVNFHLHSPFLIKYLSEKTNANKKIAWIHNDFSTTGYEIRKISDYLKCCEHFYGVSQRLVNEFIDLMPEYKNKTSVMYNIVQVDEMIKKGSEGAPEFKKIPKDCLKILSVGRLEQQKGYNMTIEVCKMLSDKGYDFKWFIIGDGTQRKHIESQIKKLHLEKNLILLGIKMNPYPYFKNCNLYVQTSLHEGYVTTITEAKIFNRPIVCTDVSGAREQINNDRIGFVTSFKTDDIVEKIELMIHSNIGYEESFIETNIKNTICNLNIFK